MKNSSVRNILTPTPKRCNQDTNVTYQLTARRSRASHSVHFISNLLTEYLLLSAIKKRRDEEVIYEFICADEIIEGQKDIRLDFFDIFMEA